MSATRRDLYCVHVLCTSNRLNCSWIIHLGDQSNITLEEKYDPTVDSRIITAICSRAWTNSLSREHHPCLGQSKVSNVSDNMNYVSDNIIDEYTTYQITYRHWSLKLDWSRCGHFVVGIFPQHSTHISTGFFVQSTCLLEFYSRKSIICTQIMLRIKEKNKKISFKLIGIALS